MSYQIELVPEQVDSIIQKELSWASEQMHRDLMEREQGNNNFIFEYDKAADIEAMKEHIKAFQLVLKYYGAPNA